MLTYFSINGQAVPVPFCWQLQTMHTHTHTHTHTHIYFWFAVLISVSLSVHEEIIGLVAGLNEIVLLKTLYSARYRVNVQ